MARVAGIEAPKFDDNEASLADLKTRIALTIDFIKSVPAAALDGRESAPVSVPVRNREPLQMDGENYFPHFALPNFFFHVTTAYALLRHNGVELGKGEYLNA